jgi:hypothetical protein
MMRAPKPTSTKQVKKLATPELTTPKANKPDLTKFVTKVSQPSKPKSPKVRPSVKQEQDKQENLYREHLY